ncbi:hypothetical protein HU200_018690 [Digitaria exilis]|uniref:Uncharacterized protein n=1 Tax=Digitaria exilis TaxID=1010633 RepID=A0A835KFY4_9POAL|nr:hypothetical protein HU200_018690 [Digitaria exilis]
MAAQQQAASVLQSLPFRAALLALCVAVLPLLPTAPEAGANGGPGQAFLAKACELLHLLFVGIAVSYGLFSRKNNAADDGRAGVAADAEKDAAAAGNQTAVKADARYAWRMFRDSIAPFDDDEEEFLPDSPPSDGREKMRSWSSLHRPEDPVVVVSNGGGRTGHATDAQATLSLPVRALRSQSPAAQDAIPGGGETPRSRRGSATGEETVLPSPIPWRSRSGRKLDDAGRSASPSPSPSPKRLSPASSLARETAAKASEEYYEPKRRGGPYRSSSSVLSPPPAPPPPPPPFLVHGYHRPAAAERRTAVAKSFKEELQDHSMRGGRGEHRYSPNTSIFSTSAYSSSNSSTAKPRNSFDGGGGGGGSSSTTSVGKSVRTIRARAEPAAAFQEQSQELPEDDAGDGRDAMRVHGLEESYSYDSYRAYQSIPRFQYERSVSDPILGGVAVSSDDTESSDDDDDEGGAYSTRTNSPRESTPEVDENEVDKKAEEFIARFREQIRRQRIESIKKSAEPRGVKHHGK